MRFLLLFSFFFDFCSPLHQTAIWFRKRDGGGAHEFGATGSQSGTLAVAAAALAATVVPATSSTAATGPTVQGGPGAAPLPTTLHPRETGMGIRVGPDRQPSIRLLAELPRSVGHANLPLLYSRFYDGFSVEDRGRGSVTGNARAKITYVVVPPLSRREKKRGERKISRGRARNNGYRAKFKKKRRASWRSPSLLSSRKRGRERRDRDEKRARTRWQAANSDNRVPVLGSTQFF